MEYKYSHIFTWSSGKPVELKDGSIPVYGSNGIIGYSDIAKYRNKIILGRVGAYCGSVEYCPNEFNATDNTLITTCNEEYIDYKYAFYMLKVAELNRYAGGSAQPLITQSILKHLKCDLPDLKTQQKIVSILSTYDDLIEKNNRKIAILQEMAEELYKEWFVRFRFPGYKTTKFIDGIPEGWEVNRIESLGVFTRGKNITASEMLNGNIPVISAGIEHSGFHNKANVEGISITISSSGANAGYMRINYSEIWAADCMYVNNINNVFYLYELLNNIRPFINNLQRGAAQPHVYTKDVNRLKILLPVEKTRTQFNNLVKDMHLSIASLIKQNDNLKQQRDLLLPRLMSGKLEVYFLDSKLCEEFSEILNSRGFMYNNSFPHNVLYAFGNRISTSVKYLNKNSNYPASEEDFICFIVFACMIVDGIQKITKLLNINNVSETHILSFHIYPEIEFSNQLTDKESFCYLRSMVFAHPYETNRTKIFKEYFGTQVSPWVIVIPDLYNNNIKEPIGFRTYTEKKDNNNFDIRDIIISFSDLKTYIKYQFNQITLIINGLKEKINKQQEEWKKIKINRNQSAIDILKEIKSILNDRHQEVYNIKRFIDYLSIPLSCSENEQPVKEYREAIINIIPELCDAVDDIDNEKIGEIENNLLHVPILGMPENIGYHLQKIRYLDEENDLSKIKSNYDFGLCMLKHFCRDLANKWVIIKPEIMSYKEIFLLVNTTLFLEYREQTQKGAVHG